MEGAPLDKVREQAHKFAAKMRELATDGYIVYDIQEEKGRTTDPRPFPFRRMGDPCEFAALLKSASGKDSIVYKCVAEHVGEESFQDWSARTAKVNGVTLLNLVGGASSAVTYTGPTMSDAAAVVHKNGVVFGGVTIAERHLKKKNEHLLLGAKAEMGSKWFITQAVYNADPMIEVINEYGTLCKSEKKIPKKIILTFAPCGREKTMKFLHWLGVSVPVATEKAILEAENPVATSVNMLCDMLTRILKETAGSNVTFGINIEHVSIFKEEVASTFDLFRRMQNIVMDNRGIAYAVRYSPLLSLNNSKKKEKKQQTGLAFIYIAFVVGIFFGRKN
eukprot:CAMPEP_0196590704 /NCGR_PEP_ID=MMETSP1081-20130531/67321_1 /TAXON_ID=36882 /ORGANISM="Pyramimonas amylifera, Strain CCMP720" /LENGTH=333 /DNA_ID=CAMNT_0041913873 /DNA_START=231 /DNA_END=1232 /DNA_ORIENTATION=-